MAGEETARAPRAGRGRGRAGLVWVGLLLLVCSRALASTPAGTVVVNVACASWAGGGTAVSEPAAFSVVQAADVSIDPPTAAASSTPGAWLQYPARITNWGNGADSFVLSVLAEQGWPAALYRDDNGDGLRQETETALATDTGSLAPGEQYACVLVVAVPAEATGSERHWLTATSVMDPGVWAQASYTSTVLEQPGAQFTATPAEGTAPLTVTFQDQSTGTPTAWAWDFGDGGASTEQHPVHQYLAAGSYSVTLTVSNSVSADTLAKIPCVVVSEPAGADFSGVPTTGEVPLKVSFEDASTGGPTAWQWDFGDGNTSTKRNPSHRYSRVGTFTVSLTVTTHAGGASATKPGYVIVDYRDVQHGQWAYQEIMAATDAGLVTGYPDGTYHPEQVVTRDQMATFLARALAGGDAAVPPGPDEPTFSDVSASHWAYRYIEYAAAGCVAQGFPGGRFDPSRAVDRAQMAAFVARALALLKGEASADAYEGPAVPTFSDVPPDHWAYRFIEYGAARGVIAGYPDGGYHPGALATRDQMAVYLARAFGVLP